MAQLTPTSVGLAGAAIAMTAASAGGDAFANDGATRVRVNNASAGAITVTFKGQKQCDQGFVHDNPVSVNAGAVVDCGPFPGARFNDASGNLQITYSGVTSLTVGVYR